MERFLLSTLLVLTLASCGGRDAKVESQDTREMEWKKTDVMDLELKPVAAFAKDWMALGVRSADAMNAMTISWGSIGELWGKPVVTVYVSKDRHSKAMMDEAEYFTVSAFPQARQNREALVYIGSHSLSDEPDKVERAGLTAELSELGNPLFKEADLALECRIIYREEFKRDLLPEDVRPMYEEMGLHTFYIGEIVNVYKK